MYDSHDNHKQNACVEPMCVRLKIQDVVVGVCQQASPQALPELTLM